MLINHCRSLGAAVADRVAEIQRRDAVLAKSALECGRAVQRFGGVVSHRFDSSL